VGHIKRRSQGSWSIWYELPRSADGERRQKTVTIRGSKRDAERELCRIEYELQNGSHCEPTKITLAEFLDQWLINAENSVNRKTFEEYRRIAVNHVMPRLGGIRLSAISPLDIEGYYQQLLKSGRLDGEGGLSSQTIRHHHTLIHKALSQAVSWRLIPNNPADAVSPPRVERVEMIVLDEAQTALLLEYVSPTRLYIPVLLAATTGMRRGEILGLKWEDINLEAATLSIRRSLQQVKVGLSFKEPKSGRGRTVNIPQVTVSALRRHKIEQMERRLQLGSEYQENGLVCPRQDGTPWLPSNLSKLFCEFIQRHPDLPKICFHGLRHGFATISLGRGIHPKIVSEGLGHSGISITLDLYSHAMPALRSEAASIFDTILQQDQ
jgi:integrase